MATKEQGIKNWLNFTLSDLKAEDDTSSKPSSFQTLQYLREDQRRRNAFFSIAQSEYITRIWGNIEKEVKECRIAFKPESNVFCDFGLRDRLLQIFLSFDIVWLRPALEVTFKSNIPRLHSNDSLNLQKFLLNKLTKNCVLQAKFSSKCSDLSTSARFCTEFNQYVLSSLLRLITLLDRCKSCKVLELNPCLFTKKLEIRCGSHSVKPAQIKSTKEAMTWISKEFLASEGDVTRHLAQLGVVLLFQQSALDEYEFRVSNFQVDLRDGVILAKLVDLFLRQGDEVCSKLRIPAISRLQKVMKVLFIESHDVLMQYCFTDIQCGLGSRQVCGQKYFLGICKRHRRGHTRTHD